LAYVRRRKKDDMKPETSLASTRLRPIRAASALGSDKAFRVYALLGAITALGAALRFSTLGLQSFWYDESFTAWLVHASPSKMLAAISSHETTPPTYYLLLWGWARLFSDTEIGLRSLPALAGTLTVPITYLIGFASTRSQRTGLLAAALVATNPLLIWYSQEARPYALLSFTTALSLLFFILALKQPTRAHFAAWAVCSALALCVHYFAGFFIAAECIWLLVRARGRVVRTLVSVAAVAGTELALIPAALHQSGTAGAAWISTLSLSRRLAQVPKQFLIGFQSPFERGTEIVAFGLIAYAAWLLFARADKSERRRSIGFFAVAAAVIAMPLMLVVVGKSYLITRNVIAACVPALAGLAVVYGIRRAGRGGLMAVSLLSALGVVLTLSVFLTPEFQRADWRGLGRALGPPTQARAVAIDYWSLPLEYYLAGSKDLPPGGASVTELDVVAIHRSQTRDNFCWWGSRCNLASAVPSTNALPPGLYPIGQQQAGQFTITRFRTPRPIYVTPQTLKQSSLSEKATLLLQAPPP
jgi:mannosyltransferase